MSLKNADKAVAFLAQSSFYFQESYAGEPKVGIFAMEFAGVGMPFSKGFFVDKFVYPSTVGGCFYVCIFAVKSELGTPKHL